MLLDWGLHAVLQILLEQGVSYQDHSDVVQGIHCREFNAAERQKKTLGQYLSRYSGTIPCTRPGRGGALNAALLHNVAFSSDCVG